MVRWLERAFAICLLAFLVVVVFAGSVGRYIGRPVIWSDEVAQALFVWVSFLAADLTLQRSGHFSVDVFASLLPARARFLLDLFIHVVIGLLLALLLVNAFAFSSMTAGRALPMTNVPASFATAAIPVGFTLMLITIVEQTVARFLSRQAHKATGPHEVM